MLAGVGRPISRGIGGPITTLGSWFKGPLIASLRFGRELLLCSACASIPRPDDTCHTQPVLNPHSRTSQCKETDATYRHSQREILRVRPEKDAVMQRALSKTEQLPAPTLPVLPQNDAAMHHASEAHYIGSPLHRKLTTSEAHYLGSILRLPARTRPILPKASQ